MEVKLENLIETIKNEAVLEAKKLSQNIIAKAEREAAFIVEQAKLEAKAVIDKAGQEAEKLKQNAYSAVKQAQRDTLLVLKQKIEELFDRFFKQEISTSLTPEFIKDTITRITQGLKTEKEIEVVLNKEDAEKLKDLGLSGLKRNLKGGVLIKIDERIDKGLKIGIKGESFYYDLTDEGIFELLKPFLSPGLREILEKDG